MKAAVLDRLGTAPSYADFAEPELKTGETLVHVSAAALKQIERAIVAGTHYSSPKQLPIIPGIDGVGRREDGTRVYFMVKRRPFGAMAQRAPADWTVPVPDGIDDAFAAAVVNPALSAWLPLVYRAGLSRGETVMILGATGTSGRMAVAAARILGAGRVIAAGRRMDILEGLGADAVIDLSLPTAELKQRFFEETSQGISVVVDYVWGAAAEVAIAALIRPDLAVTDGEIRYVSVGAMAGPTIAMPSAALRGARLQLLGSGTGNFPPTAQMAEYVSDVLRHACAGSFPMDIVTRPLSDVQAAWEDAPGADTRIVLVNG
ncbi:MAG: zinc-binding alcohol dehydrogenase family protein [Proteobacteria bacterium]|nr:zinc-binding alcohol dehydrogenase family protein [Pseudomonadota bacterium]